MSQKYKLILSPQLGVNDENATLVEWVFKDREKVNKEDVVCILESTKASFEVTAPDSGYLGILINEGDRIEVNQVIGILIFDVNLIDEIIEDYTKKISNLESKISITKKAAQLAKNNNISLDQIPKLDKMIRTHDVEKLIKEKENETTKPVNLKINKNKTSVVVYGAGNGGKTICETLELGNEFEVVAFFDDNVSGSFLDR